MRLSPQQIETHTLKFAQAVREFGKTLPMTVANVEDLKNLVQASGAIGASYVRARQADSRKSYLDCLRTCFTEVHATRYWLQLMDTAAHGDLDLRRTQLLRATDELSQIFTHLIQHAPTR
ncbi:MAG: four helix bundle protein [Bacteroidetes bacterium]|nr:MAG: four helix bundle protein [Bacteroidota bacterium]